MSICLFVSLLVCLFACLLVCLFVCLCVCVFARLLICLSVGWLVGWLVGAGWLFGWLACLFAFRQVHTCTASRHCFTVFLSLLCLISLNP